LNVVRILKFGPEFVAILHLRITVFCLQSVSVVVFVVSCMLSTPLRLHIDDIREVPSVNHTIIDLVEIASVWRVTGLEVDSL
jgi:hypothetical protein